MNLSISSIELNLELNLELNCELNLEFNCELNENKVNWFRSLPSHCFVMIFVFCLRVKVMEVVTLDVPPL